MRKKEKSVAEELIGTVIIFILALSSLALITSGVLMAFGSFSFFIFKLHKIMAGFFIFSVLIHIYIRRDKLAKLSWDFVSILKTGNIGRKRTKEIIFEPLEKLTLKELCKLYDIDLYEAIKILNKEGLKNVEDRAPFKKIALINNRKPIDLFLLILEKIST